MTPALITAIGYLVAEAAVAGVSITQILNAADATGKIPPEMWDKVLTELDAEAAKWREQRRKKQ